MNEMYGAGRIRLAASLVAFMLIAAAGAATGSTPRKVITAPVRFFFPSFDALDKFAVLDEAQGEGLGRAVWLLMREQNPRLFWRSRHGNPVNAFYYAESDGCYKQENWKVFWYGIEDFRDIERCVVHCRTLPATLTD